MKDDLTEAAKAVMEGVEVHIYHVRGGIEDKRRIPKKVVDATLASAKNWGGKGPFATDKTTYWEFPNSGSAKNFRNSILHRIDPKADIEILGT